MFFTDIPQDLLKFERTVDMRKKKKKRTILIKDTEREPYIFTCSKVSCLEMVSFSSFLIFFISLLTWNSCSCSRCCSSSAFSCCNWKMKKKNTDVEIKTLKSHDNAGFKSWLNQVQEVIIKLTLLISARISKCTPNNLLLILLTYNQKLQCIIRGTCLYACTHVCVCVYIHTYTYVCMYIYVYQNIKP